MKTNHIGIMGGTFDPIHLGHLIAAQSVQLTCGLDLVYLMPSYVPPHKTGVSPSSHRLKMLKLAIEDKGGLEIATNELDRKGLTYTVDTMRELTKAYPDKDFNYIIGADVVFDICTWKDFESVFKLCGFITMMRPGYDSKALESRVKYLEETYDARFRMVLIPQIDVSSTEIRQRANEGKSLEGLVPKSVASYIVKNNLYK